MAIKLTGDAREVALQYIARVHCMLAGIAPIDPVDGSSNWWMFHEHAEKVLQMIEAEVLKIETPPEKFVE